MMTERFQAKTPIEDSSSEVEFTMRAASRQRNAFTIVELLVVVAIMGILVSLLLPAVQSAREASRRTQCQNHLKQLGLSMLLHHDAHGYLASGGWGWGWTGDPDRGAGKDQPGGWTYGILPFCEEGAIYALGSDGDPQTITVEQREGAWLRDQSVISGFFCPSRRAPQKYIRRRGLTYVNGVGRMMETAGAIDYAANAGDTAPRWYYGPNSMQAAESFEWDTQQAQGNTGISFARSEVQLGDILDGTSKTYLLGEKYLNPDGYFSGFDPADDFGMFEGCAHDTYRWCSYSPGYNYSITPRRDTAGKTLVSRFGGPHLSGCQFVLCDGSVRQISFAIQPVIHARLGNRDDGQFVDDTDL